jgi:hypothetical protein
MKKMDHVLVWNDTHVGIKQNRSTNSGAHS